MKEFYLVEKPSNKGSEKKFIFEESPFYETGLSVYCTPDDKTYEAVRPKNEEDYEEQHYEPYETYGYMADKCLEKLQGEEVIVRFDIEDIRYLIILLVLCTIPKNVKFMCQQTGPFSVNGLGMAKHAIKEHYTSKYDEKEQAIYHDLSWGMSSDEEIIDKYYRRG